MIKEGFEQIFALQNQAQRLHLGNLVVFDENSLGFFGWLLQSLQKELYDIKKLQQQLH